MSKSKVASTQEERDRDDYNVRHYAYHIYFFYCVSLYLFMAVMNAYGPEKTIHTFHGVTDLGVAGAYYARQSAALMVVLALLSAYGWLSGSGPVRDVTLKCHFAHHLFSLLVDWYSEYAGLVHKHWQQGLFSPHPFFTFLVLFLWLTDKRRDLAAEERELGGGKK